MSKARREIEDESNIKKIIIIIVIVLAIITFIVLKYISKKEIPNYNLIDNTNEVFNDDQIQSNETEEKDNNVYENEIENDSNIANNIKTNQNVLNETPTKEEIIQSNSKNESSNIGVTDKKERAIELVKKEWGTDNSVDFVFDFANENDEYIIAVKDKTNATVRNYFKVNLEKETVEIYY